MSWFRRKPKIEDLKQLVDTRQAIVEIETHADARKEAVAEAKAASEKLNTLLVQNGFTLKIYLAAGHKPTPKTEGK